MTDLALNAADVRREIETRLRVAVEAMREAIHYEGSDENFLEWASDREWGVESYQDIGYYSGRLDVLLALAYALDIDLSPEVQRQANDYLYVA